MYLLRRFVLEHNLKLQSMLCAWTRSHVWHMKVLLYAVFKERGADSWIAGDRITEDERIAALPGPCPQSWTVQSRRRMRMRTHRLAGDPRVRAAQPTLKNVGPLLLIHALALKSRVNPEYAASSVVDSNCIRRCDRARRDPTTCTP